MNTMQLFSFIQTSEIKYELLKLKHKILNIHFYTMSTKGLNKYHPIIYNNNVRTQLYLLTAQKLNCLITAINIIILLLIALIMALIEATNLKESRARCNSLNIF